MLNAFAVALLVARVHREGALHVAFVDHVVEAAFPLAELRDIAGKEVAALAVQRVEEDLEDLFRHLVVDTGAAVMPTLEDVGDLPCQTRMAIRRRQRAGGQQAGCGWRASGTAAHQGQHEKRGKREPAKGVAGGPR
jgi:hypothetical protein